MVPGLVGKKIGMTRIFTEKGESVPVSVVHVVPNRITQIKHPKKDGYSAIQITTGNIKKPSRLKKPEAGHFLKIKSEAGEGLWEFRVNNTDLFKLGDELSVNIFKNIVYVDVQGTSKGKGFAGVIKRYHFATQDATHGNSLSHRAPGSIGQRQSPGKVFKGKKMSGHLGNKTVTTQNLKLHGIDEEKHLLFIVGGIPGANNGYILIYPSNKIKDGGEA